jgi:hypothetical protein
VSAVVQGLCLSKKDDSMKIAIALSLVLIGCGSNFGDVSAPPPNDRMDATAEAAPIHDPPSGLCCQIEHNETDSALWNSRRYDCLPVDAALQPFDPPWLCNVNEAGMCGAATGTECLTCNQPACVVGMSCLGANGTGVVLPCNQQDW